MNTPLNRPRHHKDSTDLVAPYARIRVIVFLIYVAIALVALAFRVFVT